MDETASVGIDDDLIDLLPKAYFYWPKAKRDQLWRELEHYFRRATAMPDAKAFVQGLKAGRECADCGVGYPGYVMDFDHVPGRGQKLFSLSQASGHTRDEIEAELNKCDLVCANCHRVRTHGRYHAETKRQQRS